MPRKTDKAVAKPAPAAEPVAVAPGAVERVGQTLERALDPLASAIKRATTKAATTKAPTTKTGPTKVVPGKPGLAISPLAVPFALIPPIAGVEIATGRAGFYKHEREDLLLMRFAEGTSAAGVFTRHGVGSAPVDWCKRQLAATGGADVRALVVNAGCANSFTGKPGADAVRRVATAVGKRFVQTLRSKSVVIRHKDNGPVACGLTEANQEHKDDEPHAQDTCHESERITDDRDPSQ